MPPRYNVENVGQDFSKVKHFPISLHLTQLIIKSWLSFGDNDITLGNYCHYKNFIGEDKSTSSPKQPVFVEKSFEPTKAETFSVMLVEKEGKCCWSDTA